MGVFFFRLESFSRCIRKENVFSGLVEVLGFRVVWDGGLVVFDFFFV